MKLMFEFTGLLNNVKPIIYNETLKELQKEPDFQAGLITLENTEKGFTVSIPNNESNEKFRVGMKNKFKLATLKALGLNLKIEE